MNAKQRTALSRILKREEKIRPDTFGLHPSMGVWCITDNNVAIMFRQKPEGFTEGNQNDTPAQYLTEQMEKGDFILSSTPIDIPAWKAATKGYQRKFLSAKNTSVPPLLYIETRDRNGCARGANYNAQYVLDAVEAIGAKSLLFVATQITAPYSLPPLLVMQEDWMDDSTLPVAIVLPVRTGRTA